LSRPPYPLRRDSLGYGRRQTSYDSPNGDVKGISNGLRGPLPLQESVSADDEQFCITRHRLTRSSSVFIRSASHIASRHSSSSSTSAQNCGIFWWTHSINVAVSTGAVLSNSCKDSQLNRSGLHREDRRQCARRSPRNRFQSAAENVDVNVPVADSLPDIPPPWLSLDRRHRHPRSRIPYKCWYR
jgi:hypothetical protein